MGDGMSDTAIRVSDVSKCYRIYGRPQDRLKQSFSARFGRFFGGAKTYFHEFWALRDISFEVEVGRTVGIIGRNGSGKSTLLQILCGTLSPTGGNVEIRGRVAAMLELGSGFNPEFTGRENVYMNGMVLGLTHEEIDQRFESIAAFADIGEFIEQPVKTYSSGMLVRLAFAVIAHVDADIMVIDEALAVGDAVFGQKCMRFLRRFKERGTVLFVSHDTSSVVSLCAEAIWLDKGEVRMCGRAKDVAEAYAQYCAQESLGDAQALVSLQDTAEQLTRSDFVEDPNTKIQFFDNIVHSDGWTTGKAQIESVELIRRDGAVSPVFMGGERVVLRVRARLKAVMERPIIGFFVKDRLGQSLFGHNTYEPDRVIDGLGGDAQLEAKFGFVLPMLPNGDYSMTVAIADGDLDDHIQHHWIHDAVMISVNSLKARYGLVGIPFESITLDVVE
jgi:lipopolysaccharide transport system ATP-binding protein